MSEGWSKWLENQAPLWVIYALTIVGIVTLVRQFFKYLPIAFEKHIELLERTTKSVSESADAINRISTEVKVNNSEIDKQQVAISEAAKPFARALVAMCHAESKDEVRRYLTEMEEILSRMKK